MIKTTNRSKLACMDLLPITQDLDIIIIILAFTGSIIIFHMRFESQDLLGSAPVPQNPEG